MNNYRRGITDCCFGVCGMTDSLNRSEIGWCWDCVDRLLWGYRVSCLVTIVIKDRSYGIDLFTEERRIYTSGLGLVGDPVRPYDAISVYMMMNENFKGGLNNVMLRNKDPVDSRYHQRCVDNKHEMGTRASVNKPIRVKGRFGCLYSPVHDADWLDGYPNRVGGSVITGTDATVAQYCSCMGEIPTEDWALSNRPAVWINVLEYPPRTCEMFKRYRYSVDYVVFHVEEVDKLLVIPRAQRAAKYMTAMVLWHPLSGPGAPGPLPTSTCTSCMNCEYCFGRKEPSAQ